MPNRSVVFGGALFVILILGLLFRSSGSRTGKINDNQDFSLIIPPSASILPGGKSLADLYDDTAPEVSLSTQEQNNALAEVLNREHTTISSSISTDKKWFPVDFVDYKIINPNILPSPDVMEVERYMLLGQVNDKVSGFSQELICKGGFKEDAMRCLEPPQLLPVGTTVSEKCDGKLDLLNYQVGPRNGRAFYGPKRPFFMYGSPSAHSCMGVWMQDLSRLHHWIYQTSLRKSEPFFQAVDIPRPNQVNKLETGWFAFFDRNDEMFISYEMYPQRSFAKVNATGGVGRDLGMQSGNNNDAACLANYLPEIKYPSNQRVLQGSNAITVTMCNKIDFDDTNCFETEKNTFTMTILNLKSSFGFDLYEPFVVLFKRTFPFEIYAVSKKPLWINGREKLAGSAATGFSNATSNYQFEINSIAYKQRDRNYHGYQNDVVHLTFTIDGQRSGMIDTTPLDLIQDMGMCS